MSVKKSPPKAAAAPSRRILRRSASFVRRRLWRPAWTVTVSSWRRLGPFDRFLALLLAAFFVLTAYWTWIEDPGLSSPDLCDTFERRPAWFAHARESERLWGLPVAVQMAFLRHESGFRADVRPPRRKILGFLPGPRPSTAYGYSQALDGTWREYQVDRRRPRARRDRFRDAVDFVGWYAHRVTTLTDVSLDDTFRLYLAYHQGPGGYAAGSYRGKPQVIALAEQVASTAETYARQLAGCEKALRRRQVMFVTLEVLFIGALLTPVVLYVARRVKL